MLAGYGIPSLCASLPIQNPLLRQAVTIASNLSPLIAVCLSEVFPSAIQAAKDLINPPKPGVEIRDEDRESFHDMYKKTDVAPLKSTYAFTAGISAVVHVATALHSIFDKPTAGSGLLFSGSSALLGLTSAAMSTYLTYDMRYRGFLTTKQSLVAGVANLFGNILLGPGAAISGFFYFREHIVSNLGD